MHFTRWIKIAAGAAAVAASVPAMADRTADAYPDKPIRIIVPYTPAGFNDAMARVFARKLQESWRQPVIVENKPGAGTIIGTEQGARAEPDGYTLVVVGFPLVANQFLYKKLPYDSVKDFAPVILGARSPNLLVVSATSSIRSVQDLVAEARRRPGKLNYATAGNGTSNHLTMEYFKSVAGIDLTQVPYKGSAPMVTDLLGGQVDVMFDNMPHVLPHVRAGKMRALGITGAKRSPLAPDLPTIAEQGYPGFEVAVWYGLAAPAKTPPAILDKLNRELNRILATDEVRKIFADQGVEPLGGSLEDFSAYFKEQSQRWSKVVHDAKVSLE
ncbi:MFS transporter [Pigmentiphaga sp. NML080357]|uniref:tripartite tricarboxylate transporter substrate binding protein n=1 Tax=Pigmentiphaga sp. NML080357 TaxID=2008675 RepID=UPI000B41C1EE|nr:tripartite tricarboxylate transporter substrate binding protein [Pigmentiphaga sp. NML080357]OVZ61174.1 MFS transporter [Pigmentiphaga sp. NML080357]